MPFDGGLDRTDERGTMRRMHATAAGILLGLGLAVGGAATAQTVIPGGENGDWKAYTFKKGGVTVCYMASAQIGRAQSELQSLMRISYAVFCLKKKNKHTKHNRRQHN